MPLVSHQTIKLSTGSTAPRRHDERHAASLVVDDQGLLALAADQQTAPVPPGASGRSERGHVTDSVIGYALASTC